MERKLTTIFASDVVGFSKMMGIDEVKTLKTLQERHPHLIRTDLLIPTPRPHQLRNP